MKSDWLASDRRALPEKWRHQLAGQLQEQEQLVAWMELDLDPHLNFSQGVLILTASRLLFGAQESNFLGADMQWETRALKPGLTAQLSDHAGVLLQIGRAHV